MSIKRFLDDSSFSRHTAQVVRSSDKAPEEGEQFEDIMQDVEEKLMPGMIHWHHPNFFGYFPIGRSFPSILSDMLISGLGGICFSWSSCPAYAELEYITLDWLARALDLPKIFLNDRPEGRSGGGGFLQSSSSECNFICMMAARYCAIKSLKGDNIDKHESEYLPKLVAYASRDAHSSIEKAAKMSLVKIRFIDVDIHGRLEVDHLRQIIEEDLKAGMKPFFVVGTAGTTLACAFDNFTEIGKVCKETLDIWFHVDGGSYFIIPEMRHLANSLKYADSFNINSNKMLLINCDCCAMWVRDVKTLKASINIDPFYLCHDCNQDFEFRHSGLALSRRFRAIKIWFVLRSYGISGLQAHVRNHMTLAKKFETLVLNDAQFEVCNDVQLGLVCFRLRADDVLNRKLLSRINSSGKLYMSQCIYTIRFCIAYQYATEQHIVDAWKHVKYFANDVLRQAHLELPEKIGSRSIVNERMSESEMAATPTLWIHHLHM